MPDVFISYSRRDSDFVRQLHDKLVEAKKEPWVDWEDIPLSANWWAEICEGIEQSDSFVFVITPDSVSSPVCNFEIVHALENGKRIVPIVRTLVEEDRVFALMQAAKLNQGEQKILGDRDLMTVTSQAWQGISRHNWLFFEDDGDFDETFTRLIDILDTDLQHVKEHTRLLNRARAWEQAKRDSGLLLTASETDDAERWQAQAAEKTPRPTALQSEYILESRALQRQRQRRALVLVSIALAVTGVLAVLSLLLFGQSQNNLSLANRNGTESAQNASTAIANAATATVAQGLAAENASTAIANAATATVAQGLAAENASTAIANAATATVAQGLAAQNASTAIANAATATVAQGLAAQNASTAIANAATATVAQGLAAQNAATSEANAATATVAQGQAVIQAQKAQTAEANAERNAIRAQREADRAESIALASRAELALENDSVEIARTLSQSALRVFASWQAERAVVESINNVLTPDVLLRSTAEIRALTENRDGSQFAAGDDTGQVNVWTIIDQGDGSMEYERRRLTMLHTLGIRSIAFKPDGDVLLTVSADNQVIVWDSRSGDVLQQISNQHTGGIRGVLWSPDGTQALSYDNNGLALVWAWDGTQLRETARLTGHGGGITAADWSDQGDLIATASVDGQIRLWSADGEAVRAYEGHLGEAEILSGDSDERLRDRVLAVAFSPDGSLIASGGAGKSIHLWETASGETRHILTGHVLEVTDIRWRADGQSLASIDGDEARIQRLFRTTQRSERNSSSLRVWDVRDGTVRLIGSIHTDLIESVNWSPDGRRLVTTDADGSVYLWDYQTAGEPLSLPQASSSLTHGLWLSGVSAFVTGDADGRVLLWTLWDDADALLELAQSCCTAYALTDEESFLYGLPVATVIPVPEGDIQPVCNPQLPSRLYPGVRAEVDDGDPRPLNVRTGPGLNNDVLQQIPADQTFRVINGPVCSNDIAWFEIRFGLGTVGWIAEGQDDRYFVIPTN